MSPSAGLSVISIVLVGLALIGQILGAALMPRTAGFTNAGWTLLCLGAYAISIFVMSYVIKQGMPLSLLVPIIAAGIPLAGIVIGVVFYGEPVSLTRMLMLGSASALVGIASMIK